MSLPVQGQCGAGRGLSLARAPGLKKPAHFRNIYRLKKIAEEGSGLIFIPGIKILS